MALPKRVVIVGGGITGLSAAHALVTRDPHVQVTLLERGSRLGGSIVTERRDGFTIDGGPDSWVANKPFATALARAVGVGEELMPTVEETRRVYVAWKGELHALPEGLVLAVPTRIWPVVESRLFSWRGKARMALEPFVPKRHDVGDESIADFIVRRLGREVSERLASPLLGGIFAGDAATLSLRATFPQFSEMEAKHGSLVLGMRAQRRAAMAAAGGKNGSPPSAFLSMRGGMGALIDAVAAKLARVDVRLGTGVRGLSRLDAGDARGRYAIDVDQGAPLFADDVILAVPAHAAASSLRSLDARAADELAEIRSVSTATAFLAFRRADVSHDLDAVGFIVPRAVGRPILAGTWVSSKWRHRAPEGHVLMRVFFGGAGGEDVLQNDDDALAAIGLAELRRFMRIEGEPIFSRVFRFDRASPQPAVGHLDRIGRIRAHLATWPGIHVGGSGYDGIGIGECIRQAEAIAGAVLASRLP